MKQRKPTRAKETAILAAAGGFSFWAANFAISLTPIAAEYRADLSISYFPMLVEALLGGLMIGACVSHLLVRFFDKIPTRDPILKSVLLSLLVLAAVTALIEAPAKFLAPASNAMHTFLTGTIFNVIRILALGIVIGYLYGKLNGQVRSRKEKMLRILTFVIIFMALTACTAPRTPAAIEPPATGTIQANMPNPASVYCEEMGNKLEIHTAPDGSQSGVCVFPGGSTCDEWAFYRGECGPAVQPSPTPAAPFTFSDPGQNLGQGNGMCVVEGDVDGDGDGDALISTDDRASALWLNNGMAEFTLSDQGFKASTCADLGDLNGDKALDIFFTEGTSNQVWLNDGTGNFRNSNQDLDSPESAGVALGDLDGDGDLDAFVVNWNGKPDQVFLNNGRGRFGDSSQKLGHWFGSSVALGDVDRDGDLDSLVSNNGEESDNATVLWLNDGHGKFTDSQQRLGFTNASAAALGDLDGDGDLDAFIANSSHGGANPADKVWLNNGKGIFSDSGQSLGTAYGMSVALGDLDGDGDLDAFTGSWKGGPRIWLNDGKGNFVDSKVKLASPNSAGVAIADLDNDGDLDVFAATNTWIGGDGRHRVWLNQPTAPKAFFEGVRVTNIGNSNSGFLITTSHKKILIDALFRGIKGVYTLPEDTQNLLGLAQSPFDHVDLILVTHSHRDHFDIGLVRQHLQNDPNAVIASQSSIISQFSTFAGQTVNLDPTPGKPVQKEINGIHVEALALSHGPGQPGNIGFVITVDGLKLFFTGDVDTSQFSYEEFRAYKLPEEKIDIAFIQHFYLTDTPSDQQFVKQGIGAKYIIPTHFYFTDPPMDPKAVLRNYPDAIFFNGELSNWVMP